MKKSVVAGVTLTALVLAAGGVYAARNLAAGPAYAEVVAVRPVTQTIKTPREVCRDVEVTRQKPIKDEHRLAGTAAGALLGGVLGNQVGKGRGKKLATLAAAAGGGYAGNKAQERIQQNNTYTTIEQRCTTEYDLTETAAGYDVSYELNGQVRTLRMDHDPGARLPLDEHGRVLLERQTL